MDRAPKVDRIDRALLEHLQNDARQTNRDLAQAVGLAPSSCLERVRRLASNGAITGYHAHVDPSALGMAVRAMIIVRLEGHSRDVFENFRDHIVGLDEVLDLFHMGGGADFYVHVAVRDTEHLRQLAWDGFTSRPEVAHIETSIVFEHVRCHLRLALD